MIKITASGGHNTCISQSCNHTYLFSHAIYIFTSEAQLWMAAILSVGKTFNNLLHKMYYE